jgi:HlyD family secretion protein
MLVIFKDLFLILSIKERILFGILQIFLILSSLLEILSILTIGPLVSLIFKKEIFFKQDLIYKIYYFFNINTYEQYILFWGTLCLTLLIFSSAATILTTKKLINFANQIGYELSNKIYKYYIFKDWRFYLQNKNSDLIKKIQIDSQRVSDNILVPITILNSKVVSVILIFLLFFSINWIVALTCFLIIGFFYSIFFFLIKKQLLISSYRISEYFEKRYEILSQGFDGIKDIILLNAQNFFYNKFRNISNKIATDSANQIILSQIPRNILELFIFITIIIILVFSKNFFENDLLDLLPVMSIYVLAGLKLAPQIQNIFQNISLIRGSEASFYEIYHDLIQEKKIIYNKKISSHNTKKKFSFKKIIELKNVSFSYSSRSDYILKKINLKIYKTQTIGVIGVNGSGKTTLINLLLGLLKPRKGSLTIDQKKINSSNIHLWHEKISYVSQKPFIFNGPVVDNITLNFDNQKLDQSKIAEVIKLVKLDKFINKISNKVKYNLAERGKNISGGQVQKIAIARSLYKDSEILIFDEPTNSLDFFSKKNILNLIKKLNNKKTIIIISHNSELIKTCDVIYYIFNGRLIKFNNYKSFEKKTNYFDV